MDVSLDTTAAAAKSHQSCPTLWSHKRQPTRLLHPWDSPGKSTGVGCHCHANKHKSQLRKDLAWTLNRLWDLRLPASLNIVRATEDEMAGWHHHFNGRELGQTLGDGEGQGSLVYCSPRGHKELDTAERMNNNSVWNAWNTTGANRERLCSCSTYSVVRETGINQIIAVIKSGKIYIFVRNIYMCVCV